MLWGGGTRTGNNDVLVAVNGVLEDLVEPGELNAWHCNTQTGQLTAFTRVHEVAGGHELLGPADTLRPVVLVHGALFTLKNQALLEFACIYIKTILLTSLPIGLRRLTGKINPFPVSSEFSSVGISQVFFGWVASSSYPSKTTKRHWGPIEAWR